MRVAYFADDGTEFESEHECREYEKKMSNLLSEFKYSIHAYDEDGTAINLEDYDSDDWETAFERIEYIKFDTEKAIDVFMDYAKHEYGMVDIERDIGRIVKAGERYYYDWDADEWTCLDDKLKDFDGIVAIFENK